MDEKKPIEKEYLKTQLKNLDEKILEKKYDKAKELTLEEYNKLSEDEKNNGTTYFIWDSESSDKLITAENVYYNDETSVKAEIDELKKSVSDGKTAVANAITAKGVSTATDANFSTMATNISNNLMKTPTATLTKSYTTNGTENVDVTNYKTVSIVRNISTTPSFTKQTVNTGQIHNVYTYTASFSFAHGVVGVSYATCSDADGTIGVTVSSISGNTVTVASERDRGDTRRTYIITAVGY